ncbi:type II toxin-antitoxin system VapC family toxin [soil metagenome]
MIFVDTNVFMYAVGGSHPLRSKARQRLIELTGKRTALATSAEVLQEFLHAYLPVGRLDTLDAALRLATDLAEVWPVEAEDVVRARELVVQHPGLSARDLIHLSVCARRSATELWTFDRALGAAWS